MDGSRAAPDTRPVGKAREGEDGPMPLRARLFITVAALAAVVAACLVLPGIAWHEAPILPLVALATLQAIVVAMSRFPLLTESPTAHASAAVLLTAVILLPPGVAAVLGGASALVLVPQRVPLPRILLVMSCGFLAPAIADAVYRVFDGDFVRASDFPNALIAIGGAAIALSTIPAICLGLFEVTASRSRLRFVARDAALHTIPRNIAYSFAGLLTAVLWSNGYQVVAAPALLAPLVVTRWARAQYAEQRAAHDATVRALVQAVEIKDLYTRGHSERVARISELIARHLSLSRDRIDILCYAAILHDVGKLGVPTRLLQKTGRLDPAEVAAIRLHPARGVDVVRDISFLDDAYAAILHHHERIDGLGYPSGLSGERIPRFARIIAVADAFDSMTSTRSYRGARSIQEALDELRRCAGSQFDPAIVAAIEAALEEARLAGRPWTGDGTVPAFATAERDGTVVDDPPDPGGPRPDEYDHDDPAFAVGPSTTPLSPAEAPPAAPGER
jgi:hypothetical protein